MKDRKVPPHRALLRRETRSRLGVKLILERQEGIPERQEGFPGSLIVEKTRHTLLARSIPGLTVEISEGLAIRRAANDERGPRASSNRTGGVQVPAATKK